MARKLTKAEIRILDKMSDSFMEPDIEEGDWFQVDGTAGVFVFPEQYLSEEDVRREYEGEVWEVETIHGFGARLSAPGYMDCTDWSVFDTYEEAARYLIENYSDDEE